MNIKDVPFLTLTLITLLAAADASAAGSTGERAAGKALSPGAVHVPNLQLVGQFGGAVTGVAIRGTYAYAGVGPRLVVFDIANPSRLVEVGRTDVLPNVVQDVALAGDYAFVATGESGIRVVRIADPARPAEIGGIDTPGDAQRLVVAGEQAYVADGAGGMRVIAIGQPAALSETANITGTSSVQSVAVDGKFAYLATERAGMRIVDISSPAKPVEVGAFTKGLSYTVRDAKVSRGYAYVIVTDFPKGLRVVDVSNPAITKEVAIFNATYDTYSLALDGDRAYLTTDVGGLRIIDIADPANPRSIGGLDTPGFARRVTVASGYAYVSDGGGRLRVIRVTDPASAIEVGGYETMGQTRGVDVAGDRAYVADEYGGMRILDVGDPSRPRELGVFSTSGAPFGVDAADGFAFLAEFARGLRVLDVSNPLSPTEVSLVSQAAGAHSVTVANRRAYVSGSQLTIVDVSDPRQPVVAGTSQYLNGGDYGRGVAFKNDAVYVANLYGSLNIYPAAGGSRLGSVTTKGGALDVAAAGTYAYVAVSHYGGSGSISRNGLAIFDVADPTKPVEVGFLGTSGEDPLGLRGVAVSGTLAYLADSKGGLRVIDIRDPANPVEVGAFRTPGYAVHVAVSGGLISVADREGGLIILRFVENPSLIFVPAAAAGR